jgi:hypothetical protein
MGGSGKKKVNPPSDSFGKSKEDKSSSLGWSDNDG